MKIPYSGACFTFDIKKTNNEEFPFDVLLKQRGSVLLEIPCVGEYACMKVVESLAVACAAYKESYNGESGKEVICKIGKKSTKKR